MPKIFITLTICISVFLALFLWRLSGSEEISNSTEAEITNELSKIFNKWVQKDRPSRAGLLVTFPSGALHEISHGGLDIHESRPVASISKAVTGLCIAGLIMDEQLKLDDTLARVLPKKYLRNKASGRITIEQLLTHRSGVFGNKSRKKSEFYRSLTSTVKTHGVRSTHFDRLVLASLSQGLVASPGEQYIYSNTNYLVLGKIIEHVTKRS